MWTQIMEEISMQFIFMTLHVINIKLMCNFVRVYVGTGECWPEYIQVVIIFRLNIDQAF